jgi:hypothetical protein
MLRRSFINAFGLTVAFALGAALSNRPSPVNAQPPTGRRCVGVSAQLMAIGTVRVYRAFDDGTVEVATDGQDASDKWRPVGK